MPQPSRRPPQQLPPPPGQGDAAAAAAVATAAAAGAAAAAAGRAVVKAGAKVATAIPSAAARAAVAASVLAAFVAFITRKRKREEAWLREYLPTRRGVTPDDVQEVVEEEREREREFSRRAAQRMTRDLPAVLAVPDPEQRARAMGALTDRESRYQRQRSEAMAARAIGAVERTVLRRESPLGAFWQLDPSVVEHTIGCLVMGGKFWPWEVLDRVHPPRHPGCPCRLRGYGEAIAEGLMRPGDLRAVPEAIRAAGGVVMEAEQAEALAARFGDYAALMERAAELGVLSERYDPNQPRWPKGHPQGGRFRPTSANPASLGMGAKLTAGGLKHTDLIGMEVNVMGRPGTITEAYGVTGYENKAGDWAEYPDGPQVHAVIVDDETGQARTLNTSAAIVTKRGAGRRNPEVRRQVLGDGPKVKPQPKAKSADDLKAKMEAARSSDLSPKEREQMAREVGAELLRGVDARMEAAAGDVMRWKAERLAAFDALEPEHDRLQRERALARRDYDEAAREHRRAVTSGDEDRIVLARRRRARLDAIFEAADERYWDVQHRRVAERDAASNAEKKVEQVRQEAVKAALTDAGIPLGGTLAIAGGKAGKGGKAVQEAVQLLPTAFIETANDSERPLTVKTSKSRAFFRARDVVKQRGRGYSITRLLSTHADDTSTSLHEFGHNMEADNRRITEMEDAFIQRRVAATVDPEKARKRRLMDILPSHGYRAKEVAYEDEFTHPYIGKVYDHDSREVLTMGLQQLYFGDHSKDGKEDDDLKAFTLGVLATQGQNPAERKAAIRSKMERLRALGKGGLAYDVEQALAGAGRNTAALAAVDAMADRLLLQAGAGV